MASITNDVQGDGGSLTPVVRGRQCAARSRAARILIPLVAGSIGLVGCSSLEAGPHAWFASAFDEVAPGGAPASPGATPAPAPQDNTDVNSAQVISRYVGSVAADDAQVVDIGRRVLNSGGLAADAAAAMGMAPTVSMPSRAGIDGSGICLAHGAGAATVEEDDFIPPAVRGDVQIPGMIRGLADLQARYGRLRWEQSIGLAEQLAERGIAVSGTLLADLLANGLSAEGPGGVPLKVGDVLPQTSVAAALSQLRVGGVSDFYTGKSAALLVAAGVPSAELAHWLPTWRSAGGQAMGDQQIYFGGNAAVLAQNALQAVIRAQPAGPSEAFAAARGAGGAGDAAVPTTSFVAVDALGGGVGCSVTMGKLFGTGSLVEDLDVYGAVPPSAAVENALAPAIALAGDQLTLAAAGSSSAEAPVDLAAAAWLAFVRDRPINVAVADPRVSTEGIGAESHDRINAVMCPKGSPGHARDCIAAYDPRGSGYAVTADRFGGS